MEYDRDFFTEQWPTLRAALESGGPQAMVTAILDHAPDAARTALFRFARQGLVLEQWEGKSLDAYMAVADAAVAWLGARAESAAPAERPEYLAVLAEFTFNYAADLADCWPGDHEPRTERHFARGMEVAEQSVGLRAELDKPDSSKHLGWWAFGYHQLRLGHTDAAVDCMERSLAHARRAARDTGEHDEVNSRAPFPVLIGAGYLGLARIADGEPSGPDLYGEALAALQAQLAEPERREEAEFGISQLQRVRSFIS
jgi:hypothetical protein